MTCEFRGVGDCYLGQQKTQQVQTLFLYKHTLMSGTSRLVNKYPKMPIAEYTKSCELTEGARISPLLFLDVEDGFSSKPIAANAGNRRGIEAST